MTGRRAAAADAADFFFFRILREMRDIFSKPFPGVHTRWYGTPGASDVDYVLRKAWPGPCPLEMPISADIAEKSEERDAQRCYAIVVFQGSIFYYE